MRSVALLVRGRTQDWHGVVRGQLLRLGRYASRLGLRIETIDLDSADALGRISVAARDPALACFFTISSGPIVVALAEGEARLLDLLARTGRPVLLRISKPPWTANAFRDLQATGPQLHVSLSDRDSVDYVRPLTAAPVSVAPVSYATPAPPGRDLKDRPRLALLAATLEDEGELRAAWLRLHPDGAALWEAVMETGSQRFDGPVWRLVAEAGAHADPPVTPWTEPGRALAELAGRALSSRQKVAIARCAARFPCQIVLTRPIPGLSAHPRAEILEPRPFGEINAWLAETRAILSPMPNYLTGGLSERATNAMAWRALPIPAASPAGRSLAELTGCPSFGPGYGELSESLEALAVQPQMFQSSADRGRRLAREEFHPLSLLRRTLGPAGALDA